MKVEVSNGELVDKISVLNVKCRKIDDDDKRATICMELFGLEQAMKDLGCRRELEDLEEINDKLWDVIAEAKNLLECGELGNRFIELSAETIKLNDARFLIKKKINENTGSAIREVKEGL